MTVSIIDANYTRDPERFRGPAASWLKWELGEMGITPANTAKSSDVVLVTFPAAHEYEMIVRALRRVGVEPDRTKRARRQTVIVGGGIGTSPAILDSVADVVCVGEGRNFLRALINGGMESVQALPNAWIPGETRDVHPDTAFPWDLPPVRYEDNIVRVFASRGCPKKCLFCQTGWQQAYTEAPNVQKVIQTQKGLLNRGIPVNLVTNDASALSFYDELGITKHFSASYSQTKALIAGGLELKGKVRSIRFGVEAVSERLRRAVGKMVPTEGILRLSVDLLNQGIGVRWFMIAGLPWETEKDWQELREAVMEIKRHANKGAIQLSFTAFCPDPAAPLCIAPLVDHYWECWESFRHWFFEGIGFSRRVQLFKPAAPKGRLRHAMNSMAATEAELRRGWENHDPPNWRVVYPYRGNTRKAYSTYKRRVCEGVS